MTARILYDVTRCATGCRAADTVIGETRLGHVGRFVDITPVDEHRLAHASCDIGKIRGTENMPLGYQHERIGIFDGLLGGGTQPVTGSQIADTCCSMALHASFAQKSP